MNEVATFVLPWTSLRIVERERIHILARLSDTRVSKEVKYLFQVMGYSTEFPP